ncbi:MAG: IPExxxVDY family protein [Bacteroidales bacterium]|jgi:hypothetical protein|nr:IPExxxVDY family protein [Bacteroidales bacterium]
MKTKKLKYKPDFDFDLLGITSSENDYKISWLISSYLEIEFMKCDNLTIIDSQISVEQNFSVFESLANKENIQLKLVSNRGDIGYLITELKNIDYFLLITKDEEKTLLNELFVKLKSLPDITGIFKLDTSNLKSKEKLLF